MDAALKRPEIHLAQTDAATGHKFFFEYTLTTDFETSAFEFIYKRVQLSFRYVRPAFGEATRAYQRLPEPLRKPDRVAVGDGFARFGVFEPAQGLPQGVGVMFRQPVDKERRSVVPVVQFARAPRREFEDGRAGDAPVRDQQGTTLLELGICQRKPHVRYRHARQTC